MTIVQQGQVNTTALLVPDLLVQIVPPSWTLLNGVPTNILGIVGTATWGPVNSPVIASGVADTASQFGPMQARKYDLGTAVAAASLQGAANFRLVRVTDGTDIAASTSITCSSAGLATALANAINNGISGLRGPSQLVVATTSTVTLTLTAKYTGTLGNSLSAAIGSGSAASTTKLSIALPSGVPEIFDNVGAASQTPSTPTFTSGTDGAATITATVLIGQDTIPRKGMYALRNTGASVGMLADADDSTQWTTQVAFGLSEGVYMIMTGPAGDTISNAVSAKASAGIDSYAAKLLFGDWIYINDNINNQIRLISPQGFIAGVLANLSPEQSSLNKQLYGIVGTQKSYVNQKYSNADLQALAAAGIDLITNPVPGGSYFGARIGHNSSSNAVIHGDNYTRMTNYIASTLNAGMGIYIGRLISVDEMRQAKATLDSFFQGMWQQGMIGNTSEKVPFQVVLDLSNNPPNRTGLGYQQADVKVQYLSIVEVLLVNVEGGQTVQIKRTSTTPQ
jgi:hypothetical protein